jgi:hypothetical protein
MICEYPNPQEANGGDGFAHDAPYPQRKNAAKAGSVLGKRRSQGQDTTHLQLLVTPPPPRSAEPFRDARCKSVGGSPFTMAVLSPRPRFRRLAGLHRAYVPLIVPNCTAVMQVNFGRNLECCPK